MNSLCDIPASFAQADNLVIEQLDRKRHLHPFPQQRFVKGYRHKHRLPMLGDQGQLTGLGIPNQLASAFT
ncbi:MAG: hypothetical protein COB30_006060 [Ectothiorhodospiraceae bacterium]|nr:hypothetical protein [Ectothiorhodospiraceae bacterium]